MPDGAFIIGGAIILSSILNIVTREPARVLMSGRKLIGDESYLVRATVTNQSTKEGAPAGATLIITVSASIDGVDLPGDTWPEPFAAGETKDFESVLNIPSGEVSVGAAGVIIGEVFDPSGNLLASASSLMFICPYCAAAYLSLDEAIAHQATCEMRLAIIAAGYPAPIMYPCPYCSWTGYYEWDYWRHLWNHRPDIPKPEKYACPYCQTIFATASGLMDHIRSAHGLPAPTPTPEEAAFYLWDLFASAVVGQVSTVNLQIINYGGDTGEYSIAATIDGHSSTATGKLTPAEQGAVIFTFTPTVAGTHTIVANGFTGSFEVKLPPGTLTVISWNVPTSAKGGTTISGSVTYQVTGYLEWGSFYTGYGSAPAIFIASAPVTEGIHTIPFSFFMPSNGYLYMSCYALIEYGIWYEWSAAAYQYFSIYLEE